MNRRVWVSEFLTLILKGRFNLSFKKSALIGAALLIFNSSADAAAVAGQDDWQDLQETNLSKENPVEVHGKIKFARNILHAPQNYPAPFGETKNSAEIYLNANFFLARDFYLKSRLQGERIWAKSSTDSKLKFKQLYLEKNFGVVQVRGGKIPVFDALNLTSGGVVIDSEIIGGQIKIPVGSWQILATGGVIDNDDYSLTRTTTIFDTDSKFFALQANVDFNKNISAAVGVFNIHNNANGLTLPSGAAYSPGGKGFFESGTEKNNTVFSAGLDYKFDDKFTIGGIYSIGSAKITQQAQMLSRENPSEDNGFSIQFTYGQPQIKKKNNLSAWIAYRKLGRTGTYNPAFKGVGFGEQGLEIGARYNIFENVSLETIYFNGKKISKLAPPALDAEKPKVRKVYFSVNYEF